MARTRRAEFSILALAVLAVGTAVAVRVFNGGSTPSVYFPSAAGHYRPQPERTFFWGTNLIATFTAAQRAELVRTRRLVVIAPSLDGYDLRQQEVQARKLTVLDPDVRPIFYFNTKHYLNEALYPKYLHGFDVGTMALHDADGRPIRFHATRRDPRGTGYYIDETSPAWRAFYVHTAAQVLASGHFAGIAMDSMRPLTDATDHAAATRLSASRIADWNRGQQRLLQEVRARFPGKTVLYNGISQVVPGQIDRDLGPLTLADGALNEQFCLEHAEPNPTHIRSDITLMQREGGQGKILLEKVNYDLAHALTDAQLASVRKRWGDFCLGAFLLGWTPGSTFFDFSDGYGIDQLDTQPTELDLDLGAPTASATFSGDVGSRAFQRGQVYVNLGTASAHVKLAADLARVEDRRIVGQFRAGDGLTLGPQQAALLVER